jgi:glycosyltransferase involved in cell wall biosynthesis
MLASCLMATHDRRRFVADAVACFQAQSLTDSELIVIDDGADSVLDLVPVGDHFRYVQLGGRNHFCALRDVGLAFARGRYVAVWDDDDVSHADRLAVQVAALEASGKGLCLLSSSIVTRSDESWVYTPPTPWPLDNSAVFRRRADFRFHLDDTVYSALRVLRQTFGGDVVTVDGRPELLTTRRHDGNTCQRPVGDGPEWRAYGKAP